MLGSGWRVGFQVRWQSHPWKASAKNAQPVRVRVWLRVGLEAGFGVGLRMGLERGQFRVNYLVVFRDVSFVQSSASCEKLEAVKPLRSFATASRITRNLQGSFAHLGRRLAGG